MKKTSLLLALALAAVTAPAPSGAQAPSQAPIFPTGIEIINLSLSVTDAQSNFVTSLGEKDFAVFEDGIRQELSLFTHENLPISMVLLIDTSNSMEEKLGTAQTAAIGFTKTLRPQDVAQVVQFKVRATTLQPFTNDIEGLDAAIRKTEASGPTALHNARPAAGATTTWWPSSAPAAEKWPARTWWLQGWPTRPCRAGMSARR